MHRGAVSGLPGNRVHRLGPLGEPRGSCCHDSHILHHRLFETQIHQKIHLTFLSKEVKADKIHECATEEILELKHSLLTSYMQINIQ